jgi:hypothetical protein
MYKNRTQTDGKWKTLPDTTTSDSSDAFLPCRLSCWIDYKMGYEANFEKIIMSNRRALIWKLDWGIGKTSIFESGKKRSDSLKTSHFPHFLTPNLGRTTISSWDSFRSNFRYKQNLIVVRMPMKWFLNVCTKPGWQSKCFRTYFWVLCILRMLYYVGDRSTYSK